VLAGSEQRMIGTKSDNLAAAVDLHGSADA
jgi:hypothetical protein